MDSIAGLSLTRMLGEGDRAIVWHAVRPDGVAVAVKLFRDGVELAEVDRELDALARAQGPHVVGLLDATMDARGRVALVLARLNPRSLAQLLAERGPLETGEAITVLAPVAAAVARLHTAGVAHGQLGAGAVLFDDAGAPHLASFGAATVLDDASGVELPAARRALLPELTADAVALRRLARGLLAPRGAGHPPWLAGGAVPPEYFAELLSERVFELGRPAAVVFEAAEVRRADAAAEVRAGAGDSSPAEEGRPIWLAGASLPPALLEAVTTASTALRGAATRPIGGVRRRAWVLLGCAGAVLALALFLPRGEETGAEGHAPPASPTGSASAAASAPLGDAVTGDDPIAAAALLVEARERCLRDLSVLCLEQVHQRGAPIVRADEDLVGRLREGEPAAIGTPQSLVLVERLGDTAILTGASDAGAATVVVSRGTDGWRLREVRIDR
jgi:hypothetical protein